MAVTLFHTKPTLRGYHMEDWSFTFNLDSAITAADVSKAVALDTSGPNKVKLAGDGDAIIGRLETFEDRTVEGQKVGAVELKFANTLPIKSGSTVVVGNTVVGAGAGEVKAAGAADFTANYVVEVIGLTAVVVKV